MRVFNPLRRSLAALLGECARKKEPSKMSKLARFFATSVLVVSLSAVALAGDTQGPNLVLPAPQTESIVAPPGTMALGPVQDSSIEIATEVTLLVALLTSAIL
jgi:hypothetical protein